MTLFEALYPSYATKKNEYFLRFTGAFDVLNQIVFSDFFLKDD